MAVQSELFTFLVISNNPYTGYNILETLGRNKISARFLPQKFDATEKLHNMKASEIIHRESHLADMIFLDPRDSDMYLPALAFNIHPPLLEKIICLFPDEEEWPKAKKRRGRFQESVLSVGFKHLPPKEELYYLCVKQMCRCGEYYEVYNLAQAA